MHHVLKKKALYQICIAAKQFLETVTTESFYAWFIRPNITVTNDKATHFERRNGYGWSQFQTL